MRTISKKIALGVLSLEPRVIIKLAKLGTLKQEIIGLLSLDNGYDTKDNENEKFS